MARPTDVKFMRSHEWARKEGNLVTIGVSDFAIEELNREIVYLELPEVGREVKQGDTFGVIEAVKAASDLYAPVGGRIVEVNSALVDDPAAIAEDPFGKGWMVKIEPSAASDFDTLLSPQDYEKMIESGEGH